MIEQLRGGGWLRMPELFGLDEHGPFSAVTRTAPW